MHLESRSCELGLLQVNNMRGLKKLGKNSNNLFGGLLPPPPSVRHWLPVTVALRFLYVSHASAKYSDNLTRHNFDLSLGDYLVLQRDLFACA